MPGVGGVNGPVFAGDNVAEDAGTNAAGGAMGNAATPRCLEQKLNFYDQYECALVDFSCTTEYFDTTTKEISIHFNLCKQQLAGDTQDYLIRCTVVNRGRYQMEKSEK